MTRLLACQQCGNRVMNRHRCFRCKLLLCDDCYDMDGIMPCVSCTTDDDVKWLANLRGAAVRDNHRDHGVVIYAFGGIRVFGRLVSHGKPKHEGYGRGDYYRHGIDPDIVDQTYHGVCPE